MYANKSDIDKYFKDNWTLTPIQYDGAQFEIPADNSWISISLLPYDRELIGLDGGAGRKLDYGIIRVNCYDTSVTLCYDIAYEVQAFLECSEIPTTDGKKLLVDMGIADGQGSIPLDNGVYETQINFITKKYN